MIVRNQYRNVKSRLCYDSPYKLMLSTSFMALPMCIHAYKYPIKEKNFGIIPSSQEMAVTRSGGAVIILHLKMAC